MYQNERIQPGGPAPINPQMWKNTPTWLVFDARTGRWLPRVPTEARERRDEYVVISSGQQITLEDVELIRVGPDRKVHWLPREEPASAGNA